MSFNFDSTFDKEESKFPEVTMESFNEVWDSKNSEYFEWKADP